MLERELLTAHQPGAFVKCPVTGQTVEASRLSEHIRISLLDPKWKEQRDHLLSRMQKSSLAGNADIVKNLGTFQREHDLIMRGGDVKKGTEAAPVAVPSDPAQAARIREAQEQAKLRKKLRQQSGGEPAAKRRRPNLVPSAQWLASHPGPQTLQVQIRNLSGIEPDQMRIVTADGMELDDDGVALA